MLMPRGKISRSHLHPFKIPRLPRDQPTVGLIIAIRCYLIPFKPLRPRHNPLHNKKRPWVTPGPFKNS
jgi:hypothetical protein